MSNVLTAGLMYRPTSIKRHINSVYVIEQYNHRVSKWDFVDDTFVFTLAAGQVTALSLDAPGFNYVAPTLVFSAPDLDIANPVTATGTISQMNGNLISPVLTDGGNGYSVAPTVTVVDSAGSAGAVSVSAFTVPWGNNGNGTTGLPGLATGATDDFLQFPTGSAIYGGQDRLFVVDTLNHRVRIIDFTDGSFIGSIGAPGTGDDEFNRPAHADLSTADGILAIADSRNHRVSTYDAESPYDFMAIANPPSPDTFHTPYGVKHNGVADRFYYSDLIRGKLYAYNDANGTVYENLAIGTPGTNPSDPNQLFYPGSASGTTETSGSSFLTDTRNNKIKEYDAAGDIVDKVVGAGTTEGKLYYPQDTIGFTKENTDYILVCNTLNNRIEVFNRDNNSFQSTFGSPTPVLP